MYLAKTKMLISCTVKLICAFVFAYAKSRFSHGDSHDINKSLKADKRSS